MRKVYFAGSIRGGREDAQLYEKIITIIQQYAQVLTEHIGDEKLNSLGESDLHEIQIHNRDISWMLESDLIIAEVTNPSLGVGYELGRALENNKNIICLYRPRKDKKLSAMIKGCEKITLFEYQTIEELEEYIYSIFC